MRTSGCPRPQSRILAARRIFVLRGSPSLRSWMHAVGLRSTKYSSHLQVLLHRNPRERVPSSGFGMGSHVADACQLCSPILPSRRRTTLAAISLVQHTLPSCCGVAARWSGGLRVMADHGLFGRGTYMGAGQSNPQLPHHYHSALAASSESWHPTNTAATCHDQSGGDRKRGRD
jgi:hypothetical protein